MSAEELQILEGQQAQEGKILLVDDEPANLKLLEAILKSKGYRIVTATNGQEALQRVAEERPDVILLDVMMPIMNGFEVARALKAARETSHIPIIMITAMEDRQTRIQGLAAGAEDFLNKPVDKDEVAARVRNLFRLKKYHDMVKDQNQILENRVREKTASLRTAYEETIYTLCRAAEFKDEDTGNHIQRISYYTARLAEILGMESGFVEQIFHGSPMHDIGKIGIPDRILLKPASLTPEEIVVMKTHPTLGGEILSNCQSPYLVMGGEIALAHHERWDGGGYPQGLRGERIPISARIVNICDQYDALRSKRPYKRALSHQETIHIIASGDGRTMPTHFDPDVHQAFLSHHQIFADIYEALPD
jgi:putative two-component system response regulator